MDELVKIELDNMKEKIKYLEKSQEETKKEMKEFEKKLSDFDTTQQLILQKLDTIMNSVDKMNKDIEEIKSKPANNYDKVKWAITSVIITSIVTWIIARIVG